MRIHEFLERVATHRLPHTSLWCFAMAPSHGITSYIQRNLDAFGVTSYASLDIQQTDIDTIYRYVTTLFLGQRWIYSIKGLSGCDKRTQRHVLDMLAQTQLAHHVLIFTDQLDVAKNALHDVSSAIIACDHVSQNAFARTYYTLFSQTFPSDYLRQVYAERRSLHFIHAYLIMWYYYVLGKRFTRWHDQWLGYVVPEQASLFQLAEYVFRKNATKTWLTWKRVFADYPIEFWIAFWSDQMWQAYTFVSVAQEHTVARARKVTTKLPYSFMQRDWRYIQLHELTAALTYLYSLDVHMKQGGSQYVIELFLYKWLSNAFVYTSAWYPRENAPHLQLNMAYRSYV